MKNFVTHMLLLFVLSTTMSCNKTEELSIESARESEIYAIPILHFEGKEKMTKGIVVGNHSEMMKIIKDDGFSIVKLASNVNKVFIPVTGATSRPDSPYDPILDPVDPTKYCWDEINTIYQSLYPQALAMANRECREVMLCIGCPSGGLTATMVVKPTSIQCAQIVNVQLQLSVLDVDGGLDGKDVADYINQNSSKK
ncbi:hypothetical protein [Sphingobacterium bovistauri]|uniref:Uncharacterized protein n=1 Tax=Sphingobacterium bovistauri TaxID=2781959 RepID=A0ABS7Z3F8_9SPHI|nr:hypothetical protein [Sphingobacterium bovistauri]MCA5004687.1 hypothetical protein [Sphingobacterium bovistauri]